MEILGSLDGEARYTLQAIQHLLDADRTELQHQAQFTGRPGTRIHRRDGHVLKLREEISLGADTGQRWVKQALERERELGVHHPHKTWFLLPSDDGEVVAGNVTPELLPLHMTMADGAASDWCLEQLTAVISLYADIVSRHKLRLDEGLSNFGLDAEGRLFYLDDEIYRWDRFTSFSQALGVYIRSLDQLDAAMAGKLGLRIAEIWKTRQPDPQVVPMIARMVRDLPAVGEDQYGCRDALADAMLAAVAKKRKKKPSDPAPRRIAPGGRIALLADVHANAPALAAALETVRHLGVTEGVVLGDIVGYGPHPRECIAMVSEAGFPVIKGNHDHGVASGFTSRGFNWAAKWVIDWTREILSEEELEWLGALPDYLTQNGWFAVHGAPMDPSHFYGYVYRMTASRNLDYLDRHEISRCFHGHSHMVGVHYRDPDGDDGFDDQDQDLSAHRRSLVCPGSVGKPRCGTPGVEFALLDLDGGGLEFRRVEYDLAATVKDMRRLDFPDVLIERLERGF